MYKTLLLVFIHGFKGGDDTFGTFPEHLCALLSHALPNIKVLTITYPKYETRGELVECVARFREWLENKVIDLEVANETPSPTIDPSVHTILVGHSMGGIVAAETLLLLASERPLPVQSSNANPETPNFPSNSTLSSTTGTSHPNPDRPDTEPLTFMFPHVQGLLAFDTPFLGLAPGMVAHGIEGGHKMASNAYNTYSEVASIFGWGGGKSVDGSAIPASSARNVAGALPAPSMDAADVAAAPKWASWGKMAMFAGAAGAVAAGGAAALYSQRDKISAGWSWAASHLLFIGDLAKAESLRKRVDGVANVCTERTIGAANIYTNLGHGAREGYGITDQVAGRDRTFCNLPAVVKEGRSSSFREQPGLKWIKAVNDKAKDETSAHMSMFYPRDNPGLYALGEAAKEVVTSWIDEGWYHSSTGASDGAKSGNSNDTPGSIGKDWEGLERQHDIGDEFHMRDEIVDKDEAADDDLVNSVLVDKS